MENNNTSQNQIQLPNATIVLVLGILSLLCCYCYGFGFLPSVVGLFLASKANKLYNEAPEKYNNYNNVKIGKILCLIGLVVNILWFLLVIFYFGVAMMNPSAFY